MKYRRHKRLKSYPGLKIQVQGAESGPSAGKPINIKILSKKDDERNKIADLIIEQMNEIGGLKDITDSRPVGGIDWTIKVDRKEASKYGANIASIGTSLKLLTQGVTVADYTPDFTNEVVDIIIRLPKNERTLQNLLNLKVQTGTTYVPLKNFASIIPAPKSGEVIKYNGTQSITIESDVSPGVLPDDKIKELNEFIETLTMKQTEVSFGGEAEEQKAAMTFLGGAFVAAIFLMFLILLMRLIRLLPLIVMSAIVFSQAVYFWGY